MTYPKAVSFEWRMMLPAVVLLALMSFVPLFSMIWMSLSHVSLMGGLHVSFSGLSNWHTFFGASGVWSSWWTSAVYFVATLALEMLVGVGVALLVQELVFAKNVVLSILLMPMFVAPVIVGLLGRLLADPTFGLYSWVLRELGGPSNLLGSPSTALPTTILLDVWEWTPLITLITLAGLASVPKGVIEAASLDGAGYWRRLVHIVLPSISGVVLVALLIRAMDAIRYFDIIWVTTNGGPADSTKIVPLRLYDTAFRFFNFGYAATIGLSMLVVTIVVARIFVTLLQRRGATV
jgi:multiple sugar transport system permease protein